MAMKLTTGILAIAMMTGAAWAQNPDAIDNARSVAKSLQQKQANDSDAALNAAGVPASAKPAPGAPAPAVKPAVIPSSKPVAQPVQPATVKASTASAAKTSAAPAAKPQVVAGKTAAKTAAPKAVAVKAAAPKAKSGVAKAAAASKKQAETSKATVKESIPAAPVAKPEPAVSADASKQPKPEDKKWAMNGKRDPFFSPVVQQQGGSNCSTGKKCLEIGQINLRGVVKSDGGFIAVVTNNLNKAYFLRENDPVFNGYVVKIAGDSVVFQETVQDKLGKPFTREVVKRIFTPAV